MFQTGTKLMAAAKTAYSLLKYPNQRVIGAYNISTKSLEHQLNHGNPEQPQSQTLSQPQPDDLYRHLWIKCSAHESSILDSYETFVKLTANHLNIIHVTTEAPHRKIIRRTLLASRFVHKKYRVQYELRTYYRNILFQNLTGSTLDTFLEYVERNIPEGVLFIAEKHRLGELPFELNEEESRQDTK